MEDASNLVQKQSAARFNLFGNPIYLLSPRAAGEDWAGEGG